MIAFVDCKVSTSGMMSVEEQQQQQQQQQHILTSYQTKQQSRV
jgi:hypothetical protein